MNEDRIHENIVEIERHLRKIDYIIRKKVGKSSQRKISPHPSSKPYKSL